MREEVAQKKKKKISSAMNHIATICVIKICLTPQHSWADRASIKACEKMSYHKWDVDGPHSVHLRVTY